MADAIIRPQAMWVNDVKVGTLKGSTMTVTTNDTRQNTIDGTAGHSDGITTLDFKIDQIIVFGDASVDQILDLILNKQYCDVEATLGSRRALVRSRITVADYTSEVENGTITGSITTESSGAIRFL